jgi:Undecaprenyl-phosphate glucose phosphotransferase
MNNLGSSRSTEFSGSVVAGLLLLSDLAAILAAGFIVYLAYLDWIENPFSGYLAAMAGFGAATVTAFYFARLYTIDPTLSVARQLRRIVLICTGVFLALIALAFALKISDQFSRVWTFGWYLLAMLLIVLARIGFHILLLTWTQSGRLTRNAVIVGTGEQGRRLVDNLRQRPYPWVRILALFDDRVMRRPERVADYPVAGGIDDLIRYARENRCDDIIITLPWSAEERILAILEKIKVLPACVRLSPDLVGLNFAQASYDSYSGIPVLNLLNKPLDGWNSILKTIEDRVLAAVLLLLVLPVMLVIAALIKLDSPGPVFFRQWRYGFNNQLIAVLKFRTMYTDQQDEAGTRLTARNDPRVTRLGAFLRHTSLDELPQLINVLKGEMSIVGPRPHAVKANVSGRKLYEEAVAQYAMRHKVKPGITGWAQVNGWRGETDTDEKIIRRVEHDLYYIEHWSLLLDLKIILRTIRIVLSAQNAV